MSVICNDFAWFRKDNLTSSQTHQSTPTVGSRWNKADIFVSFASRNSETGLGVGSGLQGKTHQDRNQAHLNIHASKVNVLILFTIVLRSKKGQMMNGRFFIGF